MGQHQLALSLREKSPRQEDSSDYVLSLESDDEPNFKDVTILYIVNQRLHWLGIFFVGLLVAAVVTEVFEDVLKKQVQLSYFVPLLIGHGGNAGSQSVSTMVRALALKQVNVWKWREVASACMKESAAGAFMGAVLGLVVYASGHVLHFVDVDVGLVVCVSLLCLSFLANLLGSLLPCLTTRCGLNPAVTSAPLVTTIVDALGLWVYFVIAKAILKL